MVCTASDRSFAKPATAAGQRPYFFAEAFNLADVPFETVTLIEAVPFTVELAAYAVAEMECDPFDTVVEFQLKVEGGVEAK